MPRTVGTLSLFLPLGAILCILSLHFYDWPPNRDIATYAMIARELRLGATLYVDIWDIKPPAVFVAYEIAQALIASGPLQFFLLRLVPSLLILAGLIRIGLDGGFGAAASLVSGLFWVVLSGNIFLQMHEPNTEVFINACVLWAFALFLRLRAGSGPGGPMVIGLLFALAALFKTVALAIAAALALAHLAFPPRASGRLEATRQVALMAGSGVVALGGVVLYFAATGRLEIFREVIFDVGVDYAGDVVANVLQALTLAPFVSLPAVLGLAVPCLLCVGLGVLAWFDAGRRRAWILLGAYGFSALVAAGLPGKAYAHYGQLLVPPLCLGLGWLASQFAGSPWPLVRLAPPALLVALLLAVAVNSSRDYLTPPEQRLAGIYSELYLETQKLGRRLGKALAPDETLYQLGEETGLYWYSGKRPTASYGVVQLVQWPRAEQRLARTMTALAARPPSLIVAAKRLGDELRGNSLQEWIEANYRPVEPVDLDERKHFIFYLPNSASPDLERRVLGVEPN